MNEYFVIKYTELWRDQNLKIKVCDLPKDTILLSAEDLSNQYTKVVYVTNKEFVGYVYTPYLEKLQFEFSPMVYIPSQTASLQDAAQYMYWMKGIQYNLCGELCICSIFGEDIETFLTKWEAKPLSFFHRVFVGAKSTPTGISDLVDMANVYPCDVMLLKSAFLDIKTNQQLISPGRLSVWLENGWAAIVGVKIERQKGRLSKSGTIAHWVTVFSVFPDGFGGRVGLYNPYSNRPEIYSWDEFISAAGILSGVLIRRKE